jgi:hypothetical protein
MSKEHATDQNELQVFLRGRPNQVIIGVRIPSSNKSNLLKSQAFRKLSRVCMGGVQVVNQAVFAILNFI